MIKVKGVIFLFLSILSLLTYIVLPEMIKGSVLVILTDILMLIALIFSLKDKKNNIAFVFFNATYFTFILSGCTFSILEKTPLIEYVEGGYSYSTINSACLLAFVGIVIIDFIYIVFPKERKIKNSNENFDVTNPLIKEEKVLNKNNTVIYIVYVLLFLSFICKFAMAIEKAQAAESLGYIGLYTREGSNLPALVNYCGALFYFLFMLFLASHPKKKLTYVALFLVLIMETIILNSGDRGEPVCLLLTVIFYVTHRLNIEPDFLKNKKLAIILLLIFLPFGIYILEAIKYVRKDELMNLSLFSAFTEFFKSQGVTFNILVYVIEFKNEIKGLVTGSFIFGQLKGYLTQNVLVRTVFGIPLISGNSVAMALSGFSFSSTISYIVSKISYLNGVGAGSSYLAELYIDGSWLAVIVGSIVVAIILRKLINIKKLNWIKYALLLNIFRCILAMPRGEYFKWLTEVFSIPNLVLLALVLFLEQRRKKV